MISINLIAASKGRPERMCLVLSKWISSAYNSNRISIIISIDESDENKEKYKIMLDDISKKYGNNIKLLINQNKNTVEAINRCKSEIDSDLIFLISDDTDCFNMWDKKTEELVNDWSGSFIIKTGDGINTDLITMPIFSKSYLDSKSYIYCPRYEHMFCDTELTCVAHLENSIIFANELEFKHLHYSQGHHDKDYIDEKNQSTFYTGMEIFKERLSNNFDIPSNLISGNIPKEIIEWIKKN